MLVKDAIAHCSTGAAQGLSKQIIASLLKSKHLVKINHPLIQCQGSQNNPYMQPMAYQALAIAVEKRDKPLVINSCLRTIVQQRMLRRQFEMKICGIKAAAIPPLSNHQSGLAIDIENAIAWRPYLEKFNWRWLGAFDPMHFDFKGSGSANLGKLQILEFQKLWNKHNPQNPLVPDGIWGIKTAQAVDNSPCDGFGSTKQI